MVGHLPKCMHFHFIAFQAGSCDCICNDWQNFQKVLQLKSGFSVLEKLCFLNLKITKEVFIKTLKQNETETFDALSSKATVDRPGQGEFV